MQDPLEEVDIKIQKSEKLHPKIDKLDDSNPEKREKQIELAKLHKQMLTGLKKAHDGIHENINEEQ